MKAFNEVLSLFQRIVRSKRSAEQSRYTQAVHQGFRAHLSRAQCYSHLIQNKGQIFVMDTFYGKGKNRNFIGRIHGRSIKHYPGVASKFFIAKI